ncbi:hypothetical protein CBR_g55371 [Chara braunii]|uniref:COBRA C-terminal domain-containing protein n=1 Tax=Chara braunii TaxID=69332 RepID=A0A388MCZ1_CHABU|nr:hypothetical protein CBR_g55371 [Chara braunii]|eukprot:GBG92434.1 hypothetical protein CBR_g55371 [Chara braunii]
MEGRGGMTGRRAALILVTVAIAACCMFQNQSALAADLIPTGSSTSSSNSPPSQPAAVLGGSSLVNETTSEPSTPVLSPMASTAAPSTPSPTLVPGGSTPPSLPPVLVPPPVSATNPVGRVTPSSPSLIPPSSPSLIPGPGVSTAPMSGPSTVTPSIAAPVNPVPSIPSPPSSPSTLPQLVPPPSTTAPISGVSPVPTISLPPPVSNPTIALPALVSASSPSINGTPISQALPSVAFPQSVCGIEIIYTALTLNSSVNPDKDFTAQLTVINKGINPARNWSVTLQFEFDVQIRAVLPPLTLVGGAPPLKIAIGVPITLSALDTYKVLDGAALNNTALPTNVTGLISGSIVGVTMKQFALPKAVNFTATKIFECQAPSKLEGSLAVCCNQSLSQTPVLIQEPGNTTEFTGVDILWDVIQPNAYTYYTVQLRIRNMDPYKNILPEDYSCPYDEEKPNSGWCLKWDWKHNEYISSVEGCTTTYKGDCQSMINVTAMENVTQAHSCDRSPTLMDLEPRFGALAPQFLDPGAAVAKATLVIGKQESDWNDTAGFYFPTNFSIGLPNYKCSTPLMLGEPSKLPTSEGSRQMMSALKSWSVSCGPVSDVVEPKTCCVSLSGVYNHTLAPCMACACNQLSPCNSANPPCEITLPATPQPALDAVLTSSKTDYTLPEVPKKLLQRQCKSGCGQQVHFHLSKIEGGTWTIDARVDNVLPKDLVNWMVAAQFYPNVSKALMTVHSVNSTTPDENGMIVFFGFKDYNELLKSGGGMTWQMVFNSSTLLAEYRHVETELLDPTQKITAEEELATRIDQRMLPLKVIFMGKECAMPEARYIPSLPSFATRGARIPNLYVSLVLAIAVTSLCHSLFSS